MGQSEKLKQAIRDGQQLLSQGDGADPDKVQAVLKTMLEEDRQGCIEAMRNS